MREAWHPHQSVCFRNHSSDGSRTQNILVRTGTYRSLASVTSPSLQFQGSTVRNRRWACDTRRHNTVARFTLDVRSGGAGRSALAVGTGLCLGRTPVVFPPRLPSPVTSAWNCLITGNCCQSTVRSCLPYLPQSTKLAAAPNNAANGPALASGLG